MQSSQPQQEKALIWTLIALISAVIIYHTQEIIAPILLSIFICITLYGIVLFFSKKGFNKAITTLILAFILMSACFFISAITIHSLHKFTKEIPLYQAKIESVGTSLYTISSELFFIKPMSKESVFDLTNVFDLFHTLLNALSHTFSNTLFIALCVFFILIELPLIRYKSQHMLKGSLNHLPEIYADIQHYLMMKTLCSLGFSLTIFLTLYTLSIPFADLIGLLSFFLNFIPSLGLIIILILISIAGLTHSLFLIIAALTSVILLNIFWSYFIEAKNLEKKLNLSHLTIFIALIFWGYLLGHIGVFLAVPLTVILKIFFENHPKTKKIAFLMASSKIPYPTHD